MDILIWLAVLAIVCSIAVRLLLPSTITWLEAATLAGILFVVVTVAYSLTFWSATRDNEILNGYVTSKEQNRVSCSHSYSCNCRQVCSGTGQNQTCRQECETCYEHSHDYDWNVYTTVGTFSIGRIDRQGVNEPPRWTTVIIGEPAASTNSYTNYLKAAPNSLFNMKLAEEESKKNAALIPPYPTPYDYYRVNHVLDVNVGLGKQTEVLDRAIDDTLKVMGAVKQVNVLLIFVKGQGREYKEFLERAWLGGKKNDLIIIFGMEDQQKIAWVESFSFAKSQGNAMLHVVLRDELQELGSIGNVTALNQIISKATSAHFNRVPMANFKYLEDDIRPSNAAIVVIVLLMLITIGGGSYLLHKHDLFGEQSRFGYRRSHHH